MRPPSSTQLRAIRQTNDYGPFTSGASAVEEATQRHGGRNAKGKDAARCRYSVVSFRTSWPGRGSAGIGRGSAGTAGMVPRRPAW
jgi:hypothetical protein